MHKGSEKMTSSNNSTLPPSNPINTNIPNPIDDKDNPNVQPSDSYEVALDPVTIGIIVGVASLVVAIVAFGYDFWYNHIRNDSALRELKPDDRRVIETYEEAGLKGAQHLRDLNNRMLWASNPHTKLHYAQEIIRHGSTVAELYDSIAVKIEQSIRELFPNARTIKELRERAAEHRQRAADVRKEIQKVKGNFGISSEQIFDDGDSQIALNDVGSTAQPTNNIDNLPAATFAEAYNNAPPTLNVEGAIAYAQGITSSKHQNISKADLDIMRDTILEMNRQELATNRPQPPAINQQQQIELA
jgi:hypothetical protein